MDSPNAGKHPLGEFPPNDDDDDDAFIDPKRSEIRWNMTRARKKSDSVKFERCFADLVRAKRSQRVEITNARRHTR